MWMKYQTILYVWNFFILFYFVFEIIPTYVSRDPCIYILIGLRPFQFSPKNVRPHKLGLYSLLIFNVYSPSYVSYI